MVGVYNGVKTALEELARITIHPAAESAMTMNWKARAAAWAIRWRTSAARWPR